MRLNPKFISIWMNPPQLGHFLDLMIRVGRASGASSPSRQTKEERQLRLRRLLSPSAASFIDLSSIEIIHHRNSPIFCWFLLLGGRRWEGLEGAGEGGGTFSNFASAADVEFFYQKTPRAGLIQWHNKMIQFHSKNPKKNPFFWLSWMGWDYFGFSNQCRVGCRTRSFNGPTKRFDFICQIPFFGDYFGFSNLLCIGCWTHWLFQLTIINPYLSIWRMSGSATHAD